MTAAQREALYRAIYAERYGREPVRLTEYKP